MDNTHKLEGCWTSNQGKLNHKLHFAISQMEKCIRCIVHFQSSLFYKLSRMLNKLSMLPNIKFCLEDMLDEIWELEYKVKEFFIYKVRKGQASIV